MTDFTTPLNFSGMDLAQKSLVEIKMNMRVLGIKNLPLENKVKIYAHEQYLFEKKV